MRTSLVAPLALLLAGSVHAHAADAGAEGADAAAKGQSAAEPDAALVKSDVLDLGAANFSSIVPPEELIMVEFFAPWCGHCKALAPHYEEAATILRESDLKLAKVDCTVEADLCQTHGVSGYPTIKIFKNGEATDYAGPRKTDGIVSYMKKQLLPAISALDDIVAHDAFIASDKLVIVYYTNADKKDASLDSVFDAVANKMRDTVRFAKASDTALATHAKADSPSIVLYKQFDDGKEVFSNPSRATIKKLEAFIKDNSMPLVDEIGPENFQNYADAGLPIAYLFIDPEDPKRDAHLADLKPIAAKYRGKVNFVHIDAIKFGDHGKSLNLVKGKWPAFAIQKIKEQQKWPMDQANKVKPDAIEKHVQAFLSGDLKPSVKSAPIPATQDESVYVLVTDEFDKVVFDDSKDVFVEFYAPWCGHCKKLAPIWDTLADKYADVKDKLLIAKFDATENDVPVSAGFSVSGFPTLKFKPAGSREFVDYSGDRTLDTLIDFVEDTAKNNLGAPSKAAPSSASSTPDANAHDEL